MSTALDTSVAVRLLTDTPTDQAAAARAFVRAAAEPVAVSDLVVSETYYVLRHHYRVPHGEAVRFLSELLADPRLRASGVARTALRDAAAAGPRASPGLMDRLVLADAAREALRLVTFDRDLARLPGAELLRAPRGS